MVGQSSGIMVCWSARHNLAVGLKLIHTWYSHIKYCNWILEEPLTQNARFYLGFALSSAEARCPSGRKRAQGKFVLVVIASMPRRQLFVGAWFAIIHFLLRKKPLRSRGGGTPILGHIRDVRPEWVSFPGRKPADGCKFLTKNLRMGHNFDIILPGNGWFSSKLNKTYCSLVNFYCK